MRTTKIMRETPPADELIYGKELRSFFPLISRAMEENKESNAVSGAELALLEEEARILASTLESLQTQCEAKARRLTEEDQRSRLLTAELVAAQRDEDKQMLASDEAVSHALKHNHSDEVKALSKLLKRPYFARFVIEEESSDLSRNGNSGAPTQYDYRLGYSANPECRIIDWRKSPLAKIYYEYQEGDEYCEDVQGREREGRLLLKHPVRIENGALKSVTTRYGTFSLTDGAWLRTNNAHPAGNGGIKSILPLITAEQFKTITEDARTAVLIQGIAGSGKTTVALHRLAWLLHESNSDISSEECAVIVRNEVLAEFIKMTLDAIEIADVPVYTFEQWKSKVIQNIAPELSLSTDLDSHSKFPRGFTTVLYSEEFFEEYEAQLKLLDSSSTKAQTHSQQYGSLLTQTLLSFSSRHPKLLEVTGGSTNEIIEYLENIQIHNSVPHVLSNSLLRFLLHSHLLKTSKEDLSSPVRFRHLVVDELQDYSFISLASLMNSVESTRDLTLVGDVGQALSADENFIGWDRLKEVWQIELGSSATFFTLEVSYRSTLPIMRLASYVSRRSSPKEGRSGRVPIWFHCENEERATEAALDWLMKALERYPTSLSAVLCSTLDEATQAYSLLKPRFGPQVRMGKPGNFSFDEGLIVTAIDYAKGLEFTNVLIWNPSSKAFPQNDTLASNRLYVAITRAEENLALVSYGRYSKLLPPIDSKFVRGYNYLDLLES